MSNFIKLSDVTELTVGFVGTMAENYTNVGVPFLRSLNVKPYFIDATNIKYISQRFNEKISKSILHTNDIIIVRTGVPGTCCVVPEQYNGCNCSDVVIVRPKKQKVEPHFLAAYINIWGQRQIRNNKVGAVQKHFNVHSAEELLISLPDIETQRKIATFIRNINELIQNNIRINDNLQHQLKLMYDYWFTQFDFPDEEGKPYRSSGGAMVWNEQLKRDIPQKWALGSVSDCVEKISTGLNPRDNFVLGNGNVRYITVKNLTTSGSLDFSGCDMIDEEARALVHRRSDICIGDILFASIAPLGRCFLIQQEPTDWDINESVFSIRSKADMTTPEFLYLYFQSDSFTRKATNTSTGSIFKGIRINTLFDTKMIIPDLQVCKCFTNAIKPLLAEINNNSNETAQLIALRDWLLPMLMNGQVGFNDEQEEKPQIKVSGFEQWLANQGFAARGDVDIDVLRDIYEAMDSDDK